MATHAWEEATGTLLVEVIDWWNSEPLQGVTVRVAAKVKFTQVNCQNCHESQMTDQRGYATFQLPPGPFKVVVRPDFIQDVWITAEETCELTLECPDFVKDVRHGFDW